MLNPTDTNAPLTNVSNWKILGMLIAAPLMGAAYVVFLPCVGFYLAGRELVRKAVELMRHTRRKPVTH